MKVLHIAEYYAPIGGAETYLLGMLEGLEQRGVENVVIYRQRHPLTTEHRRRSFYVPAGRPAPGHPNDDDTRERVRQVIETESPDVIYLHLVYDPAVIDLATNLRPTIAYVHNFHPTCPGLGKYLHRARRICPHAFNRLRCTAHIYLDHCATARHPYSVWQILRRTAQQQRAYRGVPHTLVASDYMRELLLQNRFAPPNVTVLPYFIDLSREHCPSEDSPPLVLFVGRIEREKGLSHLLRAAAVLHSPFRLFVVGDGSERPKYQRLVEQLGLGEQVHFAGWLARSEIADLYARARLLVFPSIWPEPFGLSGLEALACGTPVVAFDVGGINSWLEDGQNGFLVPPEDVATLAHQMDLLLQDRDLARSMGRLGQQRVIETYTMNQHLVTLLRTFNMVYST